MAPLRPASRERSAGAAGGPLPGAPAACGPPSEILFGEGPRPAGRPRRGGPPGLGCRRTARRRALRRRRAGGGPPAAFHLDPLIDVTFDIDETFCSNKETLLRDLISKASEALDKIRYESFADPGKIEARPSFYISIIPDRTNSTITVTMEERREKDRVERHAEFIGFPMELCVEKSEEKETTDPEGGEEEKRDEGTDGERICEDPIKENWEVLEPRDTGPAYKHTRWEAGEEEIRGPTTEQDWEALEPKQIVSSNDEEERGEDAEEESSEGKESEENPLDAVFDAIVALTREREWATVKELAEEAGMDEEAAKYWVGAWQQLNVVEVISKGRKQKVKMRKGVTEALGR
mmetsp:Transcript_77189/g.243870  ORF Transcript_77189/g.243870 Transcript_77189/m.243870 type:complete len:349 (+) Transcript_77189:138-1184(+)